jgi:formylglycine-generating enzyme required for sulfatase activity
MESRIKVSGSVHPVVVEARLPLEPEMILIPAGDFLMGSDPQKDELAEEHEEPQHTLYLPDYYLATTPVTNAQYALFIEATGHTQPRDWVGGIPPIGKEDHPVIWVSCYDALAYCKWLSGATRKSYRLPSEAEWEKGARGTDGYIYPWGDEWDARRAKPGKGDEAGTAPVDANPGGASPYGLLGMAGSVWEWTRSLWGKDWEIPDYKYPYQADDGRENVKADAEVLRVLRGGSFLSHRRFIRCTYRARYNLYYRLNLFGFRLSAPPAP